MKISNLKKGVVGVCAATMLTGLCAVPAFAENTQSATNGGAVTSGKGTTEVSIQSQSDQISATVPSAIKLVVGNDKQFIVPTDAEIANTGALIPVSVKSVKATVGTGTLAANLDSATDANTAVLKISKGAAFDTDNSIDLSTATGENGATLTGWTIDPSGKIGVQFEGEVNKLSSFDSISLVSLVWTIG